MKEYTVSLCWNVEANVWIATSENIHGLVMESDSTDVLIERVKLAVPELLALNHGLHEEPYALRFLKSERGTP